MLKMLLRRVNIHLHKTIVTLHQHPHVQEQYWALNMPTKHAVLGCKTHSELKLFKILLTVYNLYYWLHNCLIALKGFGEGL